jgi:hypothetical protein
MLLGTTSDETSIASQRLTNQHIAAAVLERPAEVVAWLGAIQAQDYPGGLWAVGLRTRNGTEADVERAIAAGTIVRTWPMRGTLHFVAAADVRWMLDLLAPRVILSAAPRFRQLGLDDAVLARSRKLVTRALEGGRQLRRAAVYGLLDGARISTADGRGLHILFRLALEGLICFGAREGKQQTFALLEEWAPAARRKTRQDSLAELARRYFTSHGPATGKDFAWWSGLKAADAREAIHLAHSHLVREVVQGGEIWRSAASRPAQAEALAAAYLLPPFDEFTVAYRDRTAVLHPRHASRAQSGGMLSPVIVIGGRVAGTWKRATGRGAVRITPAYFTRPGAGARPLVAAAAERYGRFLNATVRLEGARQPGGRER